MRLPSVPRVSAFFSALRDPRRLRRWAVELLVLLALFAAVSLWQNRDLPSGPAPSLAGMRNDGVAENLATKVGAGEAAVLVVFWATWCPVCSAEADNIEAVAQDWPVLSVATQSDDATAITHHLQKNRLRVPAIIDADGALARLWRTRGVPVHFVVDPAGIIRFRVVGYATESGLRARLWWATRFPA